MNELAPTQRRELRASAHHLNPVVTVAGNGLSSAVLEEIERSLQAHELIKIKVHGVERPEREQLLAQLCDALDAAPVQHIGTILIVWRKRREEPAVTPTAPSEKRAGAKRASQAKSARAFAASARRAALVQANADKKRQLAARGARRGIRKPGDRSGR